MYPKLFDLGPISIYTYGLLLVSAYLIALQVGVLRGRARGLNGDRMMDLGIASIVSALIGAQLGLERIYLAGVMLLISAILTSLGLKNPQH